MQSILKSARFITAVTALLATSACDSGSDSNAQGAAGTNPGTVGPTDTGVFDSVNPAGDAANRNESSSGATTGAADGANGALAPSVNDSDTNGGADASRTIAEADIVKIEGDTLYALSQYGGLSAINIGTQDELRFLGRHKVVATPFEMYVQGGIVFALYQGYGEYVQNEDDTWQWVQTSHVVIIDARDPSDMKELSKFAVPGYVADSRIVGDILYVASFEDGYCWSCEAQKPKTTIISLDVSTPAQVTKVDQITFDERQDYSWHRSIAVNDQRMYVAGPQWGSTGPIGSTIQVIDISDPAGNMVEGATVQVAGQITNRWQMDEFDGVFRVISQPPEWNLAEPPHVQTYTVVSSNELSPLGNTTLTLPRPEQLQSVRFDGTRAYAITFERTDPLFTIDLSDPATPVQAGALEIPGWVYHMEPRGDRVVGLGFDNSSGTGSLHVSLFDVTDLTAPTMIDRVNFGGEWGWFAEDQDRIHKAFKVLDSDGLILMPFSGWTANATDTLGCYSTWQSGVQLIDWASDALTLRGVAPTLGSARRGFLHNERLFAMSDDRVESFDITNRDAPATTAKVALAHYVTQVVPVGDKVLRIGQNWWTNVTQLDAVPVAQAAVPVTDGDIEIASESQSCYGSNYLQSAFSSGERAYLVFEHYNYDPNTGVSEQSARVSTVDTSGATPELIGQTTISEGQNSYYYYSYYTPYGLVDHGAPIVAVGSTLVSTHTEVSYDNFNAYPQVNLSEVRVADLTDPNNATVKAVAMPTGLGTTGLVTSGSIVARSHYEASPTNTAAVRFFLDRIDVSDPAQPALLAPINIPGSLLALDETSKRALTVDYRSITQENVLAPDCYTAANARFTASRIDLPYETTPGTCVQILYTINLISYEGGVAHRMGHHDLDEGDSVGQLALGDNRAFLTLGAGGYDYRLIGATDVGGVAASCFGPCYEGGSSFAEQEVPVLTISGLQGGAFKAGRLNVAGGDYWGYAPIVAHGSRAALSGGWRGKLSVIDAANADAPTLVRDVEVSGYVSSFVLVGDTAVAAMGYDGVQTISLAD